MGQCCSTKQNHKKQISSKSIQTSERHQPVQRQSTKKEVHVEEQQEQIVYTDQSMGNQCCAANETVVPDAHIQKSAKPVQKQSVEEILNELLKYDNEEDRQFEYQGEEYIVIKRVDHNDEKDYIEFILKKVSDNQNYSLKILKNHHEYNEIVEEINTIQEKQQNLKNDAIVRFYGYSFAGNQLCVLQEGNSQGTLRQFINMPFSHTSAQMIFNFINELYEALKEFYKESIYPQVLTADNIVIINNRIKIDTLGVLEFGKKITYNDSQAQIQHIIHENRMLEKKSIKESGKVVIQLLLRFAEQPFEEHLFTQCPQMIDQLERRSTAVEAIQQMKLMSQNSQIVAFVNQNYFMNSKTSFNYSQSNINSSQIY